jgi:DNA-binding transcriptional regulator YbjK
MAIRPPTHRAAGQARRSAVLEAAVKVIAEGGIGAATHRAIAARAQVSLSTTSYFFTSIDELIAEAMELTAQRLIAAVDDITTDITNTPMTLDEMIDRYVDLLVGLPSTNLAAEFAIYLQSAFRPELRPLARRLMLAFEETTVAVLRAAGAADPDAGARPVIALIDGFALQRFALPRHDTDRQQLTAGLRILFHAYVN